jgi:hypothetical protein
MVHAGGAQKVAKSGQETRLEREATLRLLEIVLYTHSRAQVMPWPDSILNNGPVRIFRYESREFA